MSHEDLVYVSSTGWMVQPTGSGYLMTYQGEHVGYLHVTPEGWWRWLTSAGRTGKVYYPTWQRAALQLARTLRRPYERVLVPTWATWRAHPRQAGRAKGVPDASG